MSQTLPFETFEKYFSCFSGHMVEYAGMLYTTAEHAYHCQRYTAAEIIREIQTARSAFLAWEVSQKYKSQQIENWDVKKSEVMEGILRAKLSQHTDVRQALLDSGEMIIVKNHPLDVFWGNGVGGLGQNELGKLWMKLREELI